MLIFSGPAASKRWQKKRALPVMQTLTAEASPVVPCCRRKGEVIPVGCQGTKGFRSQGREQQKGARQPSSTGAASHGKPHAHLFLFFLFLLGTPWYHQVIAVFQVAGRGLVCCKELLPSGLCTRAEGAPASPWDFRRLGIAG